MPAYADTLAERASFLMPDVSVVRPPGPGPFTTVIMLHGCGGRREMMDNYARVAVEAGAAAVIVDSLSPRGIGRFGAVSTVCTGLQLRGRERTGDLFAMADWARAQSWSDSRRIIVAGWSHGAWTIMDALSFKTRDEMQRATGITDFHGEPLIGVAGAFLAYPYAGPGSFAGGRAWRINPRTTAIVAGQDYIVGRNPPLKAFERLQARGANITTHVFENATHSFDEVGARDIRIRFDADATAQSEALLAQLIADVRAN